MKNLDFVELEIEYLELENGLRAGGLSISQMHRVIHRMETIEDILVTYGIWDED